MKADACTSKLVANADLIKRDQRELQMGAFGKAFGGTSGAVMGCFGAIALVVLLSCGGCLLVPALLAPAVNQARDAAKRQEANRVRETGSSTTAAPTDSAANATAESPEPQISNETFDKRRGALCSLGGESEKVILAANEDALDKVTKASIAKDEYGILELVLAGQVWLVDRGTAARILDPGILSTEVRILEGQQKGVSGVVASEFIKPPREPSQPDPSADTETASKPDPEPTKHPDLPAKYVVHFKSGKSTEIAEYEEDESGYLLTGKTGGKGRYPKSLVERIEPLKGIDKPTPDSKLRKWKTADGKHSVEAEFLGLEGTAVRLKKANGKVVTVPLEKLSEDDRRFAQEQGEAVK